MKWKTKKKKVFIRLMKKRGLKRYRRRILKKRQHNISRSHNIPGLKRIDMPFNFDFESNPERVVHFFSYLNKLIYIDRTKSIIMNFKKMNSISIDSIMYLLAIMKNNEDNVNFGGNYPQNEDTCSILFDSGFLDYVHSKTTRIVPKNLEKIRIKVLNDADNSFKVFVQIINWIIKSFGIKRKDLQFLYIMLSELMTNTLEHAYNEVEDSNIKNYWFIYVNKENDNTASFTFLDTGLGIPNTIYKRYSEKLKILGLNSDSKMLISALNGEFRSKTREEHRGKGIPKIDEFVRMGRINTFRLISGTGYVKYNDEIKAYSSKDFESKLIGTLYFWKIDFSNSRSDEND